MGKTIENSSVELRVQEVAAMAQSLGVTLRAGDSDAIVISRIQGALVALLRRDWAVRVLDAWAGNPLNDRMAWCEWRCTTYPEGEVHGAKHYFGQNPAAARLAAAEAVWPELPESVRAEIGERP